MFSTLLFYLGVYNSTTASVVAFPSENFKIYSKAIDQIKRGNRTNNDEQKAKNLYDKYKSAKTTRKSKYTTTKVLKKHLSLWSSLTSN